MQNIDHPKILIGKNIMHKEKVIIIDYHIYLGRLEEAKSRILKKLNDDHSRPVLFNESFGGSENQLRFLLKYLPDENFKDINLILNNTDHDLIEKRRINILWMQHFVNQKESQNLGSKDYINKLDYIVFNSNWNFEKYYYQFKIPESKSLVIRNAIEEIGYHKKPRD